MHLISTKRICQLTIIVIAFLLAGCKAQKTKPDHHKNPIRAMFFYRYVNINSILPTINYKTRVFLFKSHKRYVSPRDKKGWELTFEDNFDSFDSKKWRPGQPWGFFHDASLHQYHEANNVVAKDGYLHLMGEYNPKEFKVKDSTVTFPYSIGLINSHVSFKQKYGYFEIRCKNPKGPATWPAFWLTGATRWPPEIDIFEMYGKSDGKQVHKQVASIHYGLSGQKSRGTLVRKIWLPRDTDTTFHVYGCEWTSRYIKFYTDGIMVRKQRVTKRLRPWMDEEMVIIINNGFEARFLKYLPKDFKANDFVVDWVRAYKKR